jgi:hypothetical protein
MVEACFLTAADSPYGLEMFWLAMRSDESLCSHIRLN